MPKEYHHPNPVKAYRDYYWKDKRYMAKWSANRTPQWWKDYEVAEELFDV
jgi:hypothetical protein